MLVKPDCYNFLYRAVSLVENISTITKNKNMSLEAFIKVFLINVYEYMGFDRLIVLKRKEKYIYEPLLSVIENELTNSNILIDIERFRWLKGFKSIQAVLYDDEFHNYLKSKQLISGLSNGKVFVKYLELGDEYLVILESCSTFTEIPIYLDMMTLDLMFHFLESFINLQQNFQSEISKYEEVKKNLIELANTIYGGKFISNNDLLISKIAGTDVNVLIEGETGTGKSSLAYHIHMSSSRKDKPFVVIDCGTIPKELFEVELFGYEKGAFTGAQSRKKGKLELAQGGTVFFDEIGDIPHDFQLKLLRLIQEKKFTRIGGIDEISLDARFIFATNKNLESLVRNGEFREDLYYRINVFKIKLPPLRDRSTSEKKFIMDTILKRLESRYNKKVKVNEDLLMIFDKYEWPGNIRELENVLEYAVVMCDSDTLSINHLPNWLIAKLNETEKVVNIPEKSKQVVHNIETYQDIMNLEIASIVQALIRARFNITKAASILGMSRRQVEYRIKKYNIFDRIRIQDYL